MKPDYMKMIRKLIEKGAKVIVLTNGDINIKQQKERKE